MKLICVGGDHLDRCLRTIGAAVELGQSVPVTASEQAGGVAANIARAFRRFGGTAQVLSLGASCSYTVVESAGGEVLYGFADMAAYDRMDDAWLATHTLDADALLIDANCALTQRPNFDGPIYLAGVSPAKMDRLAPLIPHATGLFCNRAEFDCLSGASPAFTLATQGAAGALLNQSIAIAPLHSPPVTTNGIGDALAGYCLAGLLSGKPAEAAVTQAMEALADDYCC